MSAKYTHLAWQLNCASATEKLVLLLLADCADDMGYVTVNLEHMGPLCCLSTFGLAECLRALCEQQRLEKIKVDYRHGHELHIFQMRISEEERQSIAIKSPAPAPAQQENFPNLPKQALHYRNNSSNLLQGNAIATHDLDESEIPMWAERAFKFSGINNDHLLVWKKFVLWHKSKASELLTVARLENKLQYWLTNEKLNERQQAKTSEHSGNREQTTGNGYKPKLSPSERFRQQLIQKGKKPTF
ncbi:hypothetical protein [Vibrio sp. 11986-1-5]|uniref:hypothetical protein n=1 Tax=Vibrio sp. 11986-1-5 TaxID=2211215 RepID=UPI000D730C88|nr:hypothetical protein [Vibrio sp. 11986-1-5]PXA73621.1 hypothetical protein DMC15_06105 [Vibrio sp. 11986-1-5]